MKLFYYETIAAAGIRRAAISDEDKLTVAAAIAAEFAEARDDFDERVFLLECSPKGTSLWTMMQASRPAAVADLSTVAEARDEP